MFAGRSCLPRNEGAVLPNAKGVLVVTALGDFAGRRTPGVPIPKSPISKGIR